MHIVTKFLVVVAAILSVLLSGLVVAYAFNTRTIKDDYQSLVSINSTLESRIAEHDAVMSRARLAAENTRNALESQREELSAQLITLQEQLNTLRRDNEGLRVAENAASARVDEFTGLLKTYAELDEKQSNELAQLRDTQLRLSQREIELQDRLNDLTGQLENATESNRSLAVQISQLQRQVELGRQGGSSSAQFADGARQAPADFRGRVTGVSTDESGRIFAEIDGGTNDQLSERMKFSLVRNGSFVATLILERVDLNESIGLVDRLGRDVVILEGDLVIPTS